MGISARGVIGSLLVLAGIGTGEFLWLYSTVHQADRERLGVAALQPTATPAPPPAANLTAPPVSLTAAENPPSAPPPVPAVAGSSPAPAALPQASAPTAARANPVQAPRPIHATRATRIHRLDAPAAAAATGSSRDEEPSASSPDPAPPGPYDEAAPAEEAPVHESADPPKTTSLSEDLFDSRK